VVRNLPQAQLSPYTVEAFLLWAFGAIGENVDRMWNGPVKKRDAV